MLTITLCIIAGIIILPLLLALFIRKEYTVQSEILINATQEKVFDYIRQLKNQDHYNKWVMVDPGMKRTFTGTDGTKGFIYGWNGNKQAGEGEQEITAVIDNKIIETEIRFVRPMRSVAHSKMIAETVAANQTKVNWSNSGNMIYPMNIMVNMISKMLVKDMNISLNNLKNILEK